MKHLLLIFATIIAFGCSKDAPKNLNEESAVYGTWITKTNEWGVIRTGVVEFYEKGSDNLNGHYEDDQPTNNGRDYIENFMYILKNGKMGATFKYFSGDVVYFKADSMVIENKGYGIKTELKKK